MANLYVDPSFELDSPEWYWYAAGRTSVASYTGAWSAYLPKLRNFFDGGSVAQIFNVTPGDFFQLFFYGLDLVADAPLWMWVMNGGSGPQKVYEWPHGYGQGWKRYHCPKWIRAEEDVLVVWLKYGVPAANDSAWYVDDLWLSRLPTVATFRIQVNEVGGRALPGATVTLYAEDDTVAEGQEDQGFDDADKITVYTDPGLTTQGDNPLTLSDQGDFQVYVANLTTIAAKVSRAGYGTRWLRQIEAVGTEVL